MLMDVVFDLYGNYGPSLAGIAAALVITGVMILRFPAYRYPRDGQCLVTNMAAFPVVGVPA